MTRARAETRLTVPPRSRRRAVVLGVPTLVALAASCTSQPVILPSRDFDRPTDMTFVCMGAFAPNGGSSADGGAAETDAAAPAGAQVLSGRPMRECHKRGSADVADMVHHTFAFLPNSSSGELSVIDADRWQLVNLDPANAGFNRLPLGVLPGQIASSDDGCRLVTANAGSCDLSFVDPSPLLAPTVGRETRAAVNPTGSTIVTNVVPKAKNSGRELRVRAGEVSFLPMGTTALTSGQNLCSGDPSHQWQALATFPSCDLVALIDLPSGIIQKAAYAKPTKDGAVELVALADGEDPVCPVDCGFPPIPDASAPPEAGAPDAGASEGGALDAEGDTSEAGAAEAGASEAGAPEAGASEAGAPEVAPPPVDPGDVPFVGPGALRPGPIAIVPESGRAYVGLANAAYVLAFNIGVNAPDLDLSQAAAIQLHEGALGVNRVRLSIDPYKDKTTGDNAPTGTFIGDDPALDDDNRSVVADRQYLYVIARDGTLRVVQVANPTAERECETNFDFGPMPAQALTDAACPPVVGASVRRPGTIGPGIRLPSPPIDVAVADVRIDPPDQSETSVSGAHAWVLSASGAIYLVNIDPVLRHIFWVDDADMGAVKSCPTPASSDCHSETAPPPNTVRNRNFLGFTLALDSSSGFARLDVPPAQATFGPRIESIWTRGSENNATALTADYIRTSVVFPDQVNVTPQTWTVTWEGNLMASPRATGQFTSSPTLATLTDRGIDFCRLGVQEKDLVTIEGCTNTSQCGIGKECVLGSNGAEAAGGLPINGLCLSSQNDRNHCNDLLSTTRRYDVTSAQQSVLGLAPHKDELVRPPLMPCVPTPASSDGGADGGADGPAGVRDAAGDAADAKAADAGADALASAGPTSSCVDPQDPSTASFQCVDLNGLRCLNPCTQPGKTTGCRTGRICVSFGDPKKFCADGKCFCADAPPLGPEGALVETCLGELTPYQVGVGRGFAVAGSQVGIPATGAVGANGHCEQMPGLDPRVSNRISMDGPICDDVAPNTLDSRCNPNLADPGCPSAHSVGSDPTNAAKQTSSDLLHILKTKNDPNPCLFIGGPNDTDMPNALTSHVHALFRNRELSFMMTNLERGPSGIYQIRFDVHGGFQPQTVAIPPTVEVTMPARLLLGPFNSALPANVKTATSDVPYLFVVDQRRLGRAQGGGPTRGQLLRIHPRGFAVSTPVMGAQPWYEDLSHSQNQFPIQ
jgi:hypothetical protein